MSDNEENQRPNANYKLSDVNVDKEGEGQVTYYYDRERRLAKAPQSVRDLYNAPQAPVHRFNLFKPLVGTKHLRMTFFSIIIICVLVVALSLLGFTGTDYTMDGNRLSIQALKYDGTIIIAVNKSVKKSGLARFSRSNTAYTGAVDIAVQPALKADSGQDWQPENIFYHKIFFTLEPEERYRFSIPFYAEELALVFKTETKTLGFTVKAE